MFLVLAISNQGNQIFVMNSRQMLSLKYVITTFYFSFQMHMEDKAQKNSLPRLKTLYPLERMFLNAS